MPDKFKITTKEVREGNLVSDLVNAATLFQADPASKHTETTVTNEKTGSEYKFNSEKAALNFVKGKK